MLEIIRKEIIYDLEQIHTILSSGRDPEELKQLSDHAINDVASYKDIDVITITVLIYALYKTYALIDANERQDIISHVRQARQALSKKNFAEYNHRIKMIYSFLQTKSSSVKEHLNTVMQAARIKKGTVLLEHGLSMGQAAGLMGLSNWDLQEYASRTAVLEPSKEKVRASKRLQLAYRLFGL